jgi:hypothetical protein
MDIAPLINGISGKRMFIIYSKYYVHKSQKKMMLTIAKKKYLTVKKQNRLRGFSPQSELYRPSDRRLWVKLVPTLADRGCRLVRATNLHVR